MTGAGEQQDARSLAGVSAGAVMYRIRLLAWSSSSNVWLKAEEGKCGKVLAQPKRQVT